MAKMLTLAWIAGLLLALSSCSSAKKLVVSAGDNQISATGCRGCLLVAPSEHQFHPLIALFVRLSVVKLVVGGNVKGGGGGKRRGTSENEG
jgi:hypothetical protein